MDSESLAHTKWNFKYHIQAEGNLRLAQDGDRQDTEGAVQEEGNRDPGSRGVSQPYTYAAVDTSEVQRGECDGVSERKEQPDGSC